MNAVLRVRPQGQLGDLALDPDGAELVDPLRDPDGDAREPGTGCPATVPGAVGAHLADARVILLASRVWNGARALVASS